MTLAGSPAGASLSALVLAVSVAFLYTNRPVHASAPSWPGEGYTVAESTYLGNEHVFSIVGFNDAGHIVGSGADKSGRFTAHLYDGRASRDLSCLPGYIGSRAYGLNNRDVVVGSSYKKGASYSLRPTRACFWDAAGVHGLLSLPGLPCCRAWAVNDAGTMVGSSYRPESEVRNAAMLPTRWDDGVPHPMTLPPGASQGEARRVNESGTAIGTAIFPDGRTVACAWKGDSLSVLPPLAGDRSSTAVGINVGGTVVGLSDGKAVVWSGESPKPLGDYPGAPSLSPVDIGDAGEVVVNDQASPVNEIDDDPALPLLYRPGRGFVRIAHMVPSGAGYMFVKGLGINARGQIAVGAIVGGSHASILTLTPPRGR